MGGLLEISVNSINLLTLFKLYFLSIYWSSVITAALLIVLDELILLVTEQIIFQ